MPSRRFAAKYGAIRFLSCPGRAEIVLKFRVVSGTACKMRSPTPPKSAKVKLMLRGSVVQTKIQTGLCASISPKAPTSQFIRRPSSIPSPKGSTPDHVKNSASILHKRFTSLHLPTILLKLVVHFTLDSAEVISPTFCAERESGNGALLL